MDTQAKVWGQEMGIKSFLEVTMELVQVLAGTAKLCVSVPDELDA